MFARVWLSIFVCCSLSCACSTKRQFSRLPDLNSSSSGITAWSKNARSTEWSGKTPLTFHTNGACEKKLRSFEADQGIILAVQSWRRKAAQVKQAVETRVFNRKRPLDKNMTRLRGGNPKRDWLLGPNENWCLGIVAVERRICGPCFMRVVKPGCVLDTETPATSTTDRSCEVAGVDFQAGALPINRLPSPSHRGPKGSCSVRPLLRP